MPHLTGHDIRAEIENLAQSLAEYGHWPEEREGAVRVLRDLSRRLEQKGVGGVDPGALDRARRDIDTWRDLYYSVEAKLKQANFTLERVLSFDPVRHFLETIPPGVTLTVRHDHEPDPAPDEGQN